MSLKNRCGDRASIAAAADREDRLVFWKFARALIQKAKKNVRGAVDMCRLPFALRAHVQKQWLFALTKPRSGRLDGDRLEGRHSKSRGAPALDTEVQVSDKLIQPEA